MSHREPDKKEVKLLRLIAEHGGSMNHDEPELNPYCDDDEYSNTDTFNRCHRMRWLHSTYDDRTDESTVYITSDGRAAIDPWAPKLKTQ